MFEEARKCVQEDRTCAKNQFITPLMGYTFCDHYYGTEVDTFNLKVKGTDLMRNRKPVIRPYDIFYCEIRFLKQFIYSFLDTLTQPFILVTGAYHVDNTYDMPIYAGILLKNPYLHMWYSQNPIIQTNDPRYKAIGYGLDPYRIDAYVQQLLNENLVNKRDIVGHFYVSPTHPCRSNLPYKKPMPESIFYETLEQFKFILSPIGDRNDCFRHWEAIGFGSIPICNIEYPKYKEIFGDNMIYASIAEMNDLLEKGDQHGLIYKPPNKDILTVEYWRNMILASKPAIQVEQTPPKSLPVPRGIKWGLQHGRFQRAV